MIADGHDCICNCWCPFAHLLASIFPPGHQDRDLTINQIINRDIKCLSGGQEEEDTGMATIKPENTGEKDGQEEDIEENIDSILAAAAADAERDTR